MSGEGNETFSSDVNINSSAKYHVTQSSTFLVMKTWLGEKIPNI